jgi:outer membrane lipoprotein SlyB
MATEDVESRPVLGTPDDFADRPERSGRFVVHVVIGVLVAIVAGGWGYVMWSMTGANAGATAQVVSFSAVRPDEAQITFEVSKPDDRTAVCRIKATDVNHVEVGSREVRIPAGQGTKQVKERLDTSAQATSVHIQYCNLV